MPFIASSVYCFNTQPPEGGWITKTGNLRAADVSIHSRLKAAGKAGADTLLGNIVSIHSRLKAAVYYKLINEIFILFQYTAA